MCLFDSVELRELESQLRAGYMNKERAAQLAEKIEMKEKDKVHSNLYQTHLLIWKSNYL